MQFPALIDWRPLTCPDRQLAPWLKKPGSLTSNLERQLQGRVRVEIIFEGWRLLSPDDCAYLGLSSRTFQRGWVRDVILWVNGQAVVRARTLIPRKTFLGSGRRLRRQGVKPLGHTLFRQAGVGRSPIIPGKGRTQEGNVIWGRRSRFYLEHQPLVVMEFFLPAFVQQIHAASQ
ncbi:chorismate--pyruvate lyase family protein [Pokkaliibacter sp. CJK22405]|uniref:chorismate--pyruvate lyase family protein n=1 Tax=Pokkaliibacter sp. CJK22405 TaxID=3384615 RepID=UPI0039850D35